MAGINKGNAANVVKTALDEVFKTGFDYTDDPLLGRASDPLLFRQQNTDRSAHVSEQLLGPGYFQTKAEQQDVPTSTLRVGNQKTSTVLEYSNGMDVPRTFFDDDQHNVVNMAIEEFGAVAAKTQDKEALQTAYVDGFSSQQTNDAVAVFSNSHTTLGGLTVDNLETGVLTIDNFETANISLLEQRTQSGVLGLHSPRVLLVPSSLIKEALEITESELIPNSGNNAINYVSKRYPGLEVRYSPFLGAAESGSDVRWAVLSKNHKIVRIVREGLWTKLVDWETQRNNNNIYKAGYREVVDTLSFEGVVGSNGTT